MFYFDEGVKLAIDKTPGTRDQRCEIWATDSTAAIRGLCMLIDGTAERFGMSVQEVICRLAVIAVKRKEQEETT